MNLDDPKLTAYVLGELTTEERAEIEAALAESPKLRAEVDALQNTAKQVDVALASEKEPSLSSSQSRALAQAMNPKLEKTRPFSLARWILWGGVTACCAVVLAGVFLPALSKAKSRSSRVAALNAARLAQVERELDDSTREAEGNADPPRSLLRTGSLPRKALFRPSRSTSTPQATAMFVDF